jgi:hypothetical protein
LDTLPGLETIVIPLPDNLPFPEVQKHRKEGFHCGVGLT